MPETSRESKKVLLRAEHGDTIHVETLGECRVVQRYGTYYGPKLRVEPVDNGETDQFILHAGGPESELILRSTDSKPLREVACELIDVKQYEICTECGKPIKNSAHRTRSIIGVCATDTDGGGVDG